MRSQRPGLVVFFLLVALPFTGSFGCYLAMSQVKTEVENQRQARPNVLFISVDDLNDWIGCMKGHPQAQTPNMDRLAASGVLFSNAHCPAPACNPSRSAIMTGVSPHVSGIYDNRQKMRELLPDEILIPKYFSQHGYWSAGSGKILHYFTDADSWDDYFPRKETENPFPSTLYPDQRPVSIPRAGPWQYIETDWGPLDVTDEEFGGDWSVAEWIGDALAKRHEQPFFFWPAEFIGRMNPGSCPKSILTSFRWRKSSYRPATRLTIWTIYPVKVNDEPPIATLLTFRTINNGNRQSRATSLRLLSPMP